MIGFVKTESAEEKNTGDTVHFIAGFRAAPHDPHTRHSLAFMNSVELSISLMLILISHLEAEWRRPQLRGCTLWHPLHRPK